MTGRVSRFALLLRAGLCAGLCAAPLALAAQDSASAAAAAPLPPVLSPRDSAAVERAGRLVADGQGIAGRALIDTLLALAAPGSGRYAEFLFWRAAYAATAAEAERDYRRLAVEFPLSPRAEDALVALAQLEMARGDRALALRHIERLTMEHPTSQARAKAGYWAGRIYFEMNDPQRACLVLQAARNAAAVPPAQPVMAARIEYEMQKCRGVQVGLGAAAQDSGVVARIAAAPPAPAPAATSTSAAATAVTAAIAATAAPPPPRPAPARDTAPAQRAATTSVATGTVVAPDTTTPRAAPAAAAAPSAPSRVPSVPAPSSGTRSVYSIQIAAYDTPADAETAARRVRGRGLEARVDADAGMYKVRVGRYRTRAEAAAALREVKEKGMRDAWVVTAAGQP